MTTKTYPPHYTQADVALIERIQAWMAERKFSQAALARLSRVAASTLNQILNGGYVTSPTKQLGSVESAMRHADETTSDTVVPVETSVYKLAHTACQMARRYRNFAVLSCWVGTGKTFAVKQYAKTHPNTHLIEADPTMTQQTLVKMLARRVAGFEGKGSQADRFNAVVDSLRNTDSLLIVDEAETLTGKQLHLLRRLRDLSNVGILLCGTENLSGIIKPETGQFEQIRSRTGFWPETVRSITPEDAAALVQSGFGTEDVADEVVLRMYQYCKGSARMLVEGLIAGIKEFRRGRALDVKLVDAVAKQALCLKSLT
jgi:DNA transposition AAA+ family ATPase